MTKFNALEDTVAVIPDERGCGSSLVESPASRWVALLIGLMMILVAAVGVPDEEMLQDTLKSAVVAMVTLGAALVFVGLQGRQNEPVIWHGLIWLPLGLAAYAMGSMLWSHAYLGGVEACRWFVFGVIVWLVAQSRLEDLEARVIAGIHWGVTIASVWTALQFWNGFNLFAQGPNPASTFVNRNFFAEYAVCVLPFSIYLMLQARDFRVAAGLSAIIGYNVVALMMTGTRSALLAALILVAVTPILYWRSAQHLHTSFWGRRRNLALAGVFFATVLGLGSMPTQNHKLLSEFGPQSAIARALGRTASVSKPEEYITGSFSVRALMWRATGRMIIANPVIGVGAGAWEVFVPLFQDASTQLETDYYAHNEVLQLVAEYGVVGWLFLSLLLAYLLRTAKVVWLDRSETATQVAGLRIAALTSLGVLLVVSNAGFPWRLAGTGALFAISLGVLGACDASANHRHQLVRRWGNFRGVYRQFAIVLCAGGLFLAGTLTIRAAATERSLIRSIKLAMTIARSGSANNAYWGEAKDQALALARQGITWNPHYRKLTSVLADEFARAGDWKNAVWMYESLITSRPYVVAIMANITRAYMELGDLAAATFWLKKVQALQPAAPSVRSLGAIMLYRTGREAEAAQQIKVLFQNHIVDYELVRTALRIGQEQHDFSLQVRALELSIANWPQEAFGAWLKLGDLYADNSEIHNRERALQAYRAALVTATPHQRAQWLEQIQPDYWRHICALEPKYCLD